MVPDLVRMTLLMDLLGSPQRACPSVHLTGTNGKTSTARMTDGLLRGRGWRTGRFTSPHLQSMTERITLDGQPLSEEAFVAAYADVAPYLDLVDADQDHPLSFFETVVAMAYFDMDLYEPTRACLEALGPYVTRGTVVGFDEVAHPGWPGETVALREVRGLDRIRLQRTRYAGTPSFFVVE